jgi:hypothetical protein
MRRCVWARSTSARRPAGRSAGASATALALHTTIRRIDAQRRESGEAAKWEQDLAELRENLRQGPQKGPHADRIVPQREAGKTGTPSAINRSGA